MGRVPEVGDCVLYCDTHGIDHEALVNAVFGNTPTSCINLVYVSSDTAKQDQYGRQLERSSSCVYKTGQGAHGNYWRWHGDTPNEYVQPSV